MAGMALKGQCNLVSIMVCPEVSLKEKFSKKKAKTITIAKKLRVMQHFQILLTESSVTAFIEI